MSLIAAEPFVPPYVVPPARELSFPGNLVQLVRNNIGLVPQEAYEKPVMVTKSFPRMAFITGPDEVETILRKEAPKFPKGRLQNETLEPLFGNAMISSEGADWKWQRAITAPLFRHSEILNYLPVMRQAATSMLEHWRQDKKQELRPINRDMFRVAFNVISKTMLVGGADDVIDAIEKGHSAYFSQVNWWILYKMLGFPAWLPRPGGSVMRKQEKNIHDAVTSLVRSRKADAEQHDDLLARLVKGHDPETGEAMSEQRLVNNIIAFLVAGYDTTALALAWSIYMLAQNPEWAQAARDQVRQVLDGNPVGVEHLDQLTIIDQIINETLRLYPTAPIIVRDILEDIELSGITISEGTFGLIPIYAIHRHRSFWPNPNQFDPSRFEKDLGKTNRYRFLPFGAGPRICIGAAFTMIEAKVVLATLLNEVNFETPGDCEIRPVGQMFLTMERDIPIRVRFLG